MGVGISWGKSLSFNEALASAQAAAKAPAGILRIGLVKTEHPPQRETQAILEFQRKYPNTDLSIRYSPSTGQEKRIRPGCHGADKLVLRLY